MMNVDKQHGDLRREIARLREDVRVLRIRSASRDYDLLDDDDDDDDMLTSRAPAADRGRRRTPHGINRRETAGRFLSRANFYL